MIDVDVHDSIMETYFHEFLAVVKRLRFLSSDV